ncbi:CBS domain-containing protein [Chelatococcus asaccharovorans]|nr:CBS domain-containing protein [Chelatococcus asaccharovorans]MBS7706082.1 CBS domain-containing protein [Chelatococcus asaccharovorans]
MTTDVVSVRPDTSVKHVAKIMRDRRLSGLPVLDDEGKLAGIITEGDLMRRSELYSTFLPAGNAAPDGPEGYVKGHSWRVGDVMTAPVITAAETDSLPTLAALLTQHGIKRVPILHGDRVVGVVSRADLLWAIAEAAPAPISTGDRAIRLAVATRLREDCGLTGPCPVVTVTKGIVHLWGTVTSQGDRDAARVAAETVTGVVGVKDHLRLVGSSGPDSR